MRKDVVTQKCTKEAFESGECDYISWDKDSLILEQGKIVGATLIATVVIITIICSIKGAKLDRYSKGACNK